MAAESIKEEPPMASQISKQPSQDQPQQQLHKPEASPSSSSSTTTSNAVNYADSKAPSKMEEQQTTISAKASPQKGESLTTTTMNAANSSDSNPPMKKMEELQQQPTEEASSTTTATNTNAANSMSPRATEEPKSSSTSTTTKASTSEEQQQPAKEIVEKATTNQAQPEQQNQGEEKVNAATSSPSQQVKDQQQQQQPPPSQNAPQQEPPSQQTSTDNVNVVDRSVDAAQMEKDLSASQVKEEVAKPEGEDAKKSEEPKEENGQVKQKEVKFADGIEAQAEKSEIEESSSSREQTTLLSDLKEYERKALLELKSKIEEAVLLNKFFDDDKTTNQAKATDTTNNGEQQQQQQQPSQENQDLKKEEGEESSKPSSQGDEKNSEDQTPAMKESKGKEIMIDDQNVSNAAADAESKTGEKREAEDSSKAEEMMKKKEEMGIIDKEISLWGAPLMPSKGDGSTDVVLLKFLRAREFRVDEAFDMLKNTLKWRKENKIDSILDEQDSQMDALDPVVYMDGRDREGNPICYNVYGMLGFDKSADKLLGDEEKRERFLRWRVRKMEKSVKELDFNPGGTCEILQINDLKNTPLPTKKEIRLATRQAVETLQDNYPEFVSKNIFINVPLWYYAFSTVLSPFLTPRTKNKFIQARTSKVTEILLKYIAAEQLPVRYGGLKMDNDPDFGTEDEAQETWVKSGSTEIIEIPVAEGGKTMVWDLTVSPWEVSYKEEFVPNDERSYTVIVQKSKKITWQEGTIRNSFRNGEPGKILLTIDNPSFKKKRILYRYKAKNH